jgi:hypothetical protein
VDVARDRLWEQAGERKSTMIGLFTLAPKKVVSVVVPREWEKSYATADLGDLDVHNDGR